MIQDSNFSFHTYVSVEGYTCKTDATACLSKAGADAVGKNKMAFQPKTVTVDQFLQYATSGHAFSNIFAFDPNQKYWVTTSSGKHYESYPVYRVGPNKGTSSSMARRLYMSTWIIPASPSLPITWQPSHTRPPVSI